MGYIGNQATPTFSSIEKQTITGDGSTGYTLTNSVANGNDIAVFVNNVRQEPGSGKAYTASGTTITFSAAINSSDDCYVLYLGRSVATTTPPDDSVQTATIQNSAVTTAKIADDAVTAAKVASTLHLSNIKESNGTNEALSINSSGYIARTKNCAFLAHTPTAASATADTVLKWSQEIFDSDSCFNATTGLFTAPVNGYYFFSFHSLIKDNNYMVADFQHSGMSNDVRIQSRAVSANGGLVSAGHVFQMNANETMGIYNNGATYSEAYQDDYCAFSGFLISAL